MKSKTFKLLMAYVLSFLLVLQYPITTLAQSNDGQDAAGTIATDRAAGEKTHEFEKNGLKLTVTYPETITCGQEIEFKLDAAYANDPNLNNGEILYRIGALNTTHNSEIVMVYDVSYGSNGSYTATNNFKFTFCASGTYYITFGALYRTPNPANPGTYIIKEVDTGWLQNGIVLQINDPQYPSVEQIVDNVAKECLAKCSTDYEKALWLNDWLVEHCTYDDSYSYCSAEGALARGTGTCEAYHRAYVMLLNKVGISTGRITGNGHVWTAVKMDGKWYQVDTTWNDARYEEPNIDLKHLYFGLNDDITTKVHSDHRPVPGYESTSLDQNYFIKSGEISKWSDPLMETVKQHIAARDTSFTIDIAKKTPNAPDYASAHATLLYSLVAHVLSSTNWSDDEALDIQLSASYASKDAFSGTMTCTVRYVDVSENPDPGDGSGDGSGNSSGSGSVGGSGDGSNTGTDNGDSVESASGTWQANGTGWWFQYSDGSFPYNTWEKIGSNWYWFDYRGYMATGWQYIGGNWYYLMPGGAMATGWQYVGNAWYYLGSNGAMTTGWQYVGNAWYYMNANGAMATGWQLIDGYWFYLTPSGAMATGWQYVGNAWYYMNSSGGMTTGWQYINDEWFYLTPGGSMATGWQLINGYWYYLTPRGAMATGWQYMNGTWYYLHSSGPMMTGWQLVNDTWYYLQSNGAMAANTWVDNFYLGSSGAWTP